MDAQMDLWNTALHENSTLKEKYEKILALQIQVFFC